MLNHIVMMKFKPAVTQEDIEHLESLLDELPNSIMEIQMYEFGRDIIRSERSFDFAIVSLFANTDSLQRYQNHPDHLIVTERLGEMCDRIVTVDFMGTDAGDLKTGKPDSPLLGDFDTGP